MGYVLLGILVLGLVATIVAAVMNSKVGASDLAHLPGHICWCSSSSARGGFFYLGARTLAMHKNWRERYQSSQQQVAMLESQLLPLTGGMSPDGLGVEGEIPRLKREVSMAIDARGGGVYYDVKAGRYRKTASSSSRSARRDPSRRARAEAAEGMPAEVPAEPPPSRPPAINRPSPPAAGTGW